jgi:hypothetical protein
MSNAEGPVGDPVQQAGELVKVIVLDVVLYFIEHAYILLATIPVFVLLSSSIVCLEPKVSCLGSIADWFIGWLVGSAIACLLTGWILAPLVGLLTNWFTGPTISSLIAWGSGGLRVTLEAFMGDNPSDALGESPYYWFTSLTLILIRLLGWLFIPIFFSVILGDVAKEKLRIQRSSNPRFVARFEDDSQLENAALQHYKDKYGEQSEEYKQAKRHVAHLQELTRKRKFHLQGRAFSR